MDMNEAGPDTCDEGYIHQFQPEFASSRTSTELKVILSWNISQIIMTTNPISTKIRNEASCFKFDQKSSETETTTRSKFSNGGKAIVEQILT